MDWKRHLADLAVHLQDDTASSNESEPRLESPEEKAVRKGRLCLRYEKRNGKPATIISEFSGNEDELKALAKKLKNTLGVGGSAKDDEILLQGDVRQKAASILQEEGFQVKGAR